ncbi:MAG: YetF domain-containing protein [Clostridia bacterium]
MNPQQEKLVVNIVLDGHILKENLNYTGNDELWLQKQLVSQGFNSIHDVFLATCDSHNNLSIFSKKDFNHSHDIFE